MLNHGLQILTVAPRVELRRILRCHGAAARAAGVFRLAHILFGALLRLLLLQIIFDDLIEFCFDGCRRRDVQDVVLLFEFFEVLHDNRRIELHLVSDGSDFLIVYPGVYFYFDFAVEEEEALLIKLARLDHTLALRKLLVFHALAQFEQIGLAHLFEKLYVLDFVFDLSELRRSSVLPRHLQDLDEGVEGVVARAGGIL